MRIMKTSLKAVSLLSLLVSTALLGMVLSVLGAGARAVAEPGKQQVRQRVRVVYQLTDVVVRDGRGNYARGLGSDDFILKIRGREVPVKSVDEFAAPSPENPEIKSYLETVEVARERGEPLPDAPVPPRFVVILFDRYNMGDNAFREAKETAKEIVLGALLPHDRVAVFMFNKTLRTLTGPTSSRERILAAIDAANAPNNNDSYRPQSYEVFPPLGDEFAMDRLKMKMMEKSNDFRAYIESLRILAKSLEKLSGRKTFLIFSEGPNIRNPLKPEDVATLKANAQTLGMSFDIKPIDHLSRTAVHFELSELSKYLASTNASVYTIRRGAVTPEWTTGADLDIQLMVNDLFPGASTTSALNDMHQERIGVLQDFASMSNSKFFDAGVDLPKLLEALREEIGNYYVLGFEPPEGTGGEFLNLDVSIRNPDYRVVCRQGFFSVKPFEKLTSRERAIHLEEGFLTPGLLNELDLRAVGVQLPWKDYNSALIAFSIDSQAVGTTGRGEREVEIVINLEDRQSRIRYRAHNIFKAAAGAELPRRLWFNTDVPVLQEPCAVYLAIRENADGLRSTWRQIFAPSDAESAQVAPPMLISTDMTGNLADWKAEDVRDGVKPADPVAPGHFTITGRLLADNTVAQGAEADLLLVIGNLSGDVDPTQVSITAQYFLDPEEDDAYTLKAADEKVNYIPDMKVVMISARLPLGLAQRPAGELVAVIKGIFQNKLLMSKMPYAVANFSRTKAIDYLQDERIQEYK